MKILTKEETLFNKESFDDLYFEEKMMEVLWLNHYNKKSRAKSKVLDIYNNLTSNQIDAWKELIKSIKNNNLDMVTVILRETFQIQKRDAEIIALEIMIIETMSNVQTVRKKLNDYLFKNS